MRDLGWWSPGGMTVMVERIKFRKGNMREWEGIETTRGIWYMGLLSNGPWMYHEVMLTTRSCTIQPISWTASRKIWFFSWLTPNTLQFTMCDNCSAKHRVAISQWLTDMGLVKSNKEKTDYHTGFNYLKCFSLQKYQSNSSHRGTKDGSVHNIQWCHLFIVRG